MNGAHAGGRAGGGAIGGEGNSGLRVEMLPLIVA